MRLCRRCRTFVLWCGVPGIILVYIILMHNTLIRINGLLDTPGSDGSYLFPNRRHIHTHQLYNTVTLSETNPLLRTLKHDTVISTTTHHHHLVPSKTVIFRNGSICPSLIFPQNIADKQTFQPVLNNSRNAVFSAFRSTDIDGISIQVRVLGYSERTFITFCQIWSTDGTLTVVRARNHLVDETHGRRFSPVWYICQIPRKLSIHAVSMVTKDCDEPLNILPVMNAERPQNGVYLKNFTVCVSPFSKSYRKSYELIEKIELDSMFGADYFVFYNYSVGEYTNHILDYYAAKGRVGVVQWQIPLDVNTWPAPPEIHYYGQMVSLNDCMYRNARTSRYIVVTDLDEIIVPMQHRNWSEMLDSIISTTNSNVFVFRCIFFRKEWPDYPEEFPEKGLAKKYKIMSLLKMGSEQVKGLHERPKTILDPSFVDTTGVHEVRASKRGIKIYRVPPETGLEFHFRDWENPNDANKLTNTRMLKYAAEITGRISHVWDDLSSKIPLPANCSC